MGPVQGTVPACSFSCSTRRPEGRLRNERPVCVQTTRRRPCSHVFRKAACSSKRAQRLANTRLRGNSRTTHLGPFGEVIRATGPMAKLNPFMFSTKFYDWETGLYYYGFRYYNPSTGRWPSRDLIGEPGFELVAARPQWIAEQSKKRMLAARDAMQAFHRNRLNRPPMGQLAFENSYPRHGVGVNLYSFVSNDPMDFIDEYGLMQIIEQSGNVTFTPCPRCPCLLRFLQGLKNIWGLGGSGPIFSSGLAIGQNCDFKSSDHHILITGDNGSATILMSDQQITVGPNEWWCDCDIIEDMGTATGIYN